MSDGNTKRIWAWLRDCEFLPKENRFRVDYTSESPTEYALYSVPSNLRYHENILGDAVMDDIQTQDYIFATRSPYGADTEQNLINLELLQKVQGWIVEKNAQRQFPEWDGGVVKSVVPTLTGAPVQVGSSTAKYQIRLKITYRRI